MFASYSIFRPGVVVGELQFPMSRDTFARSMRPSLSGRSTTSFNSLSSGTCLRVHERLRKSYRIRVSIPYKSGHISFKLDATDFAQVKDNPFQFPIGRGGQNPAEIALISLANPYHDYNWKIQSSKICRRWPVLQNHLGVDDAKSRKGLVHDSRFLTQ